MKIKLSIIIVVISINIVSCITSDSKTDSESEQYDLALDESKSNKSFVDYISHFTPLQLPITLYPCGMDIQNMKLYEFKPFEYGEYNTDNYTAALGRMSLNKSYIATIVLNYADCYLPALHTYTIYGEKIDSALLAIDTGGGSDIGYQSVMYTQINKDLTFYVCDSVCVWQIDSLMVDRKVIQEEYVVFFTGKILDNGKIEMSKTRINTHIKHATQEVSD
mgnify:FL=1